MRHRQWLGGGSYSVNMLLCFVNIHFLFDIKLDYKKFYSMRH